ncbi:SpeD S-adenosylmethionine decarboxylase [uncultured Caudovirales phage]|uniref:SpeD S-adenosylmethionine decarboxylase n=1 Tax=uncultured Caudovirales phage TaxID=2100421 RepID=A0A6J5LE98_9CAUD|nr:SpeD S-adenosylmethionine decarboxylase [uncultured Caudovirales phage]
MEKKDYFKRDCDGNIFVGTHVLLDIRNCAAGSLDSCEVMEQVFKQAVEVGKANLLHINLHKFEPNGVTGVAILSESHISVHTWPEKSFASFDIFMCGDSDPEAAARYITDYFKPEFYDLHVISRGQKLMADNK